MAKEKKKLWFIAVFALFIAYFLIAARPIPRETVLKAIWLSSLDSDSPVFLDGAAHESEHAGDSADQFNVIPFVFGDSFGYVDINGQWAIKNIKQGHLSMSPDKWSEYGAEPSVLEIKNNRNEIIETIDNPGGYPVFLDGSIYIIGSGQNTLSKIDAAGSVIWTYEFTAPITCADAAAGFVAAGSIDGTVEVLNPDGKELFAFEPGGSRYSVILGCVLSRDGTRFALISGIDKQRFLVFERFGGAGGDYKIIYHEFLGKGFRRPVHISFIDQDRRIVFERENGLGIYEINSRSGYLIPLDGEVAAIDDGGVDGQLFVIISQPLSEYKKLVGVNLPDKIFVNASFKTNDVFMGGAGSFAGLQSFPGSRTDLSSGRRLFIGGGRTIASFELEKK